jgi:DNA-binding SARP family transcriptional activator/TolB-like protein/Tfp pilus assembly protein PilF
MSDLDIRVLGNFSVVVDGKLVEEQRWLRKKARLLVKLLAITPGKKLHREQAIEILWPGVEADLGLNNLHKVIHAARRAFEPELSQGATSRFLHTQDSLVALAQAGVWIDAEEFEARARDAFKTSAIADLEAAQRLYSGDLLAEDLYEDWASVPRERLRLMYQQVLERLGTKYEAERDPRCVEVLNRLLAASAANEGAHRLLMRFYAANGRRDLALNQYRVCCELLKKELGANPDGATVRLHERIMAGEVGVAGAEATLPKAGAEKVTTSADSAGSATEPRDRPVKIEARKRSWRRLWQVAAAMTLLLLGALTIYRSRGTPEEAKERVRSVAIMPLATAEGSRELDYVAEGITESVINELSQLRQVRVMARSIVYGYRAKGLDAMTAAAEMKVQTALIGTISKRGGNLLLAAELVRVPEGTRLWGNQYELSGKDLISVQDRISSEIAASLGLRLSSADRAHLAPWHPADPEAYRLYIQARFFWNRRSKEGYLKSIELFQEAIARDPAYARAYAGLSDSYSFLGRDEAPTKEYMPRAKEAAQKALALDEKLAEAHASLAMMSNVYEWNFAAAEREFKRALELDPSYPTTHLFYGVFLASQGRLEEAQLQLDEAARLDPLSPIIALCRGYPASFRGDINPAIGAAQEALELAPDFGAALEDLMIYFERQGRQDAAMKQAIALLHARAQDELAHTIESVFQKSGYQAALRRWFEAEEKRANTTYVSPSRIGQLAMRAGEMDKAFAWLNRAADERNPALVYLGIDPKYERLRSDSRYAALCARVGVRPAAR